MPLLMVSAVREDRRAYVGQMLRSIGSEILGSEQPCSNTNRTGVGSGLRLSPPAPTT